MTEQETNIAATNEPRAFPRIEIEDGNTVTARVASSSEIEMLLGMRTKDGAEGVFYSAISALGASGKEKAQMVAAIYSEIEPRDGIEAMLVGQMAATHVAMTTISARLSAASSYAVRESCERSMTRLSRTYLAQMDALKKYRAKAQQLVRVERVTVNEGGQAIVGDVTHAGGGCDAQNRR